MTTTIPRHHNKRDQRCTVQRKKKKRKKKKRKKKKRKKKSDTSSKTRKDQNGHGDEADGQKLCGDQKGHKDKTCKPKPTASKDHTPNSCPECSSGNLSITKILKRNITKALRTVNVITTSHSINTYKCRSCSRDGIESETGLPNSGSYDSSMTTEVADDYACRMPFRMIADCMVRHGITLSSGTVHNIMRGQPVRIKIILNTGTKNLDYGNHVIHLLDRQKLSGIYQNTD